MDSRCGNPRLNEAGAEMYTSDPQSRRVCICAVLRERKQAFVRCRFSALAKEEPLNGGWRECSGIFCLIFD